MYGMRSRVRVLSLNVEEHSSAYLLYFGFVPAGHNNYMLFIIINRRFGIFVYKKVSL